VGASRQVDQTRHAAFWAAYWHHTKALNVVDRWL
jgi:hypothetical protein